MKSRLFGGFVMTLALFLSGCGGNVQRHVLPPTTVTQNPQSGHTREPQLDSMCGIDIMADDPWGCIGSGGAGGSERGGGGGGGGYCDPGMNPNGCSTATVCIGACDDGTDPTYWPSWLTFPSRSYIYFNVAHFWTQHLACHLRSSVDEFMDQTASDLNRRISAGAGPTGLPSIQYVYGFNDQGANVAITYRASKPGADYLVGTAFIQGAPNC